MRIFPWTKMVSGGLFWVLCAWTEVDRRRIVLTVRDFTSGVYQGGSPLPGDIAQSLQEKRLMLVLRREGPCFQGLCL